MVRVAIVTDSTADLPAELRRAHGISMVPLNVHFGTEIFRDQIDLSNEAFMTRLQQAEELPTTSQPSSGLFEETFRRLAADHDAIVAVLISSKLSGTVQSAAVAAEAVADVVPVEVVDSLTASMALGFQAIRAAELAASGLDAPEIADRLRAELWRYHILFFVDTLEYLQRGGRIGRAAALVGSVLNLKPLLRIDEGQVVPFERTRTRGKAITGLIDFAGSLPHVERLAVMHSTTPDDAAALADRLGMVASRDQIVITRFSPVIGTHLGPGALGIAVVEGEGS